MLFILNKKNLLINLTKKYGINIYTSKSICKNLGLNPQASVTDLNQNQIKKITKYINTFLVTGNDLKKKIIKNNKKSLEMKKIKSFRILKGLPIRGQRTRSNAKTSKKLNIKIYKNDYKKESSKKYYKKKIKK